MIRLHSLMRPVFLPDTLDNPNVHWARNCLIHNIMCYTDLVTLNFIHLFEGFNINLIWYLVSKRVLTAWSIMHSIMSVAVATCQLD